MSAYASGQSRAIGAGNAASSQGVEARAPREKVGR